MPQKKKRTKFKKIFIFWTIFQALRSKFRQYSNSIAISRFFNPEFLIKQKSDLFKLSYSCKNPEICHFFMVPQTYKIWKIYINYFHMSMGDNPSLFLKDQYGTT